MAQQSHSWACIWEKKPFFEKNTCISVFTAPLFTIAKIGKQPKCPSTEERIKKIWYIYNGILCSNKKEQNNAIYSNMNGSRDCHTKRSQTKRRDITHMWNLIKKK